MVWPLPLKHRKTWPHFIHISLCWQQPRWAASARFQGVMRSSLHHSPHRSLISYSWSPLWLYVPPLAHVLWSHSSWCKVCFFKDFLIYLAVLSLGCGTRVFNLPYGIWDPQLRHMGSINGSLTRDQSPALGAQSLSHWITRKSQGVKFWAPHGSSP